MSDKKLKDIPDSGNIIDETAIRDMVFESMEEEGRYYNELNEKLKQDPEYQLTPEKLEAFEKKLRRARRNPFRAVRSHGPYTFRRLNKAAVIVSVLLIVVIVSVVSVSSIRDYTINFLLGLNETHGDVYHMPNGILVEKEDMLAPSFIPDNYSLVTIQYLDDSTAITYINTDGDMLTYVQRPESYAGTIDTEDSLVKEVKVNGNDARLSIREDGTSTLIWQTKDYLFSLSCSDKNIDLIQVAESVSKN